MIKSFELQNVKTHKIEKYKPFGNKGSYFEIQALYLELVALVEITKLTIDYLTSN